MEKPSLEQIREDAKQAYGTVPSFFDETARYTTAPAAVYLLADEALLKGVLSRREQQVVLLELARYHNSRYDAVIHARIALDAGLSAETVGRLLEGDPLADDRLQALVDATNLSCERRAWFSPKELRSLRKRGVRRGELYEIFAFVGMKKMTAFTHHISEFPIEAPLRPIEEHMKEQMGDRFEKPETLRRQRLFMG